MAFLVPNFAEMKPQEVKVFIRTHLVDLIAYRQEVLDACGADWRKTVQALAEYFLKLEKNHLAEVKRVQAMHHFDSRYGRLVAGVDEVGRGPLAGPIVGAAVIFKQDISLDDLILGINDSKKLSAKKREELVPMIKEKALSWAIFEHSNDDIDQLGLAFCNNNIFVKALSQLSVTPEVVLSDGFPIRNFRGRNEKVLQGDSKSAAIACASILAKVYRDQLMAEMDQLYPGYGFAGHVGYASKAHIEAIQKLGPCQIHRRSFLTRILEGTEY